jgi:hypothetical protein
MNSYEQHVVKSAIAEIQKLQALVSEQIPTMEAAGVIGSSKAIATHLQIILTNASA